MALVGLPFSVGAYLATDTTSAIVLLAFPVSVGALYFGPTLAMLHTLVKPEMRSLASATGPAAKRLLIARLGTHPRAKPDASEGAAGRDAVIQRIMVLKSELALKRAAEAAHI